MTKLIKKATTAVKAAKTTKVQSVADVARAMNVNPKVARAKLRRAKIKASAYANCTKTSEAYKLIASIKTRAE